MEEDCVRDGKGLGSTEAWPAKWAAQKALVKWRVTAVYQGEEQETWTEDGKSYQLTFLAFAYKAWIGEVSFCLELINSDLLSRAWAGVVHSTACAEQTTCSSGGSFKCLCSHSFNSVLSNKFRSLSLTLILVRMVRILNGSRKKTPAFFVD